ncbi:ECF RNA polymerase sigma factor SigW [Planctomycetes bacterium Poly30]|uniref:ECF RNA polymerase sigma factor SigW n=1 Tax=Saltatorellus ferox TaxID=2528018 RepID=A0A518EV03_9BACT|nr:ECF RNA polymerase sigma factor SigW [Planctomycetes bacterium Poly30]
MTSNPRISFETLLAETAALRRLAGSLVADAASADDLVQEAVLAALSDGPAVRENPGGWLRATVKNLARQRVRSRANAAARERAIATYEASASTAESVIAAERQRALLEAIMELADPYRDAVLARHLRGLSPSAISEETGAPVPTVKKRIERGLAQLKVRLGARYGEGGAWALALLPLCRPEVRAVMAKSAVSGAAGAAVKSGSKLGGGALFVGAAATILMALAGTAWYLDQHEDAVEPSSLSGAELEPSTVTPELLLGTPTSGFVTTRVAPAETKDAGAHGESSALAQSGQVAVQVASDDTVTLLGLDGEPIRSAEVRWSRVEDSRPEELVTESQEHGWTDDEGHLSFTRRYRGGLSEGEWTIDARPFAPIGVRQPVQDSCDYLMAPAVRLAGRVVDSNGDAVAGAQVRYVSEPALCLRLTEAIRHAGFRTEGRSVTAGSDGSFDLGFVPADALAMVNAYSGRAHSARVETPVSSDLGVVLVVRREKSVQEGILRGRVEHVDGTACARATVRFKYHEAEADDDGRFEVGIPDIGADESPRITTQDESGRFGAVEGARLRSVLEEVGAEVRIEVPDAMGAVQGTLLHPDGSPARLISMALFDGTPKGSSSATLERIESSLGGRTDREGRFELIFLRDRPYTLRFYSFEPLMVHDVVVDPAEADPWTITLPVEPNVRSAEGVVVDRRGEPVAGARAAISIVLDAGGFATGRPDVVGLSMTTDAEGHFFFPSLPAQGVEVAVTTDEMSSNHAASYSIASFEPGEAKRIEVDPLCEVILSVADEAVTAIGARDGGGKDLTLLSRVANHSTYSENLRREAGSEFPLLFVPQSTVELILRAGYRELRTEPVRLERGKLNRLRL